MAGGGLIDFTGKDLPEGATIGSPPSAPASDKSKLIDFTGKNLPAGARVGSLTEHVDMAGGPLMRDPKHPFGFSPEETARAQMSDQTSSMDRLPTGHQLNIAYLAKRNDPSKLRDYLKANGYAIRGWDADGNITFSDKSNRLYKANSFAAIPAGVGALPAAGQVVGTIAGGALTGGVGGEAVGAGLGEAAGEYGEKAILRAAGVPVKPDLKEIAENAAVAAGTQAVLGAAVPAIVKNLSGYSMGEEAAAARETEIGAAGEKAASKQGERLLGQVGNVETLAEDLKAQEEKMFAAETAKVESAATKAAAKQQALIEKTGTKGERAAAAQSAKLEARAVKTQGELDKFRITVREQAKEALGKEQEARELEQLSGRTPAEVQARKAQLIGPGAETMKAAREPYYAAYDNVKSQQGALFDHVFEDVPKNTPVPIQLGASVQGVKDFATQNQLKFSSEVNGLINRTSDISGEEIDPAVIRGQVTEVIRGKHPDPGINARFNTLTRDFIDSHPGEAIQPEQLQGLGRQALGMSAEPTDLGTLLGLRSRWLTVGRGRSATAADRWAANRMVSAIDDQMDNVPGLTDEARAALTQARDQYHEFKNLFDNKLQDSVFKASDPTEVAKAIFEGHEKIPLNLIESIKDDSSRMTELRNSYHDYLMDAGGPDKARAILARDDKNGVLKALMGNGAYGNYQTWLRTPNYQRFAERALTTEIGRQAFQKSIYDAFGTPESRAMVDKFREAQELFSHAPNPADVRAAAISNLASPEAAAEQVRATGMAQIPQAVAQRTAEPAAALAEQQTRLANMPSPQAAQRVETAAQMGTQNPQQAAARALYESGQKKTGIFTGGGLSGYIKRRAAFMVIAGMMNHPAIWFAAGGEMAYDTIWSLAMRSPESAQAYWNFLHKVATSKGFQTAGRAFISLNSAMLDNLIRQEMDARRRQNQQQGPSQ